MSGPSCYLPVLRLIERAANVGGECPTNQYIADLLGANSISTGARAIACLEGAGLITVQRFGATRTVTIAATGKYTRQHSGREHFTRGGTMATKPARAAKPRPAKRDAIPASQTEALIRVDRDPCPRCGVRADVGCRHHRARIGMGAF